MKVRTGCKACDLAMDAAKKKATSRFQIRPYRASAVKLRVTCTEGHTITVTVHPRAAVTV